MAHGDGDGARVDPIKAWLQAAIADAERRGLPELKPLLEGLAQSTRQLRAAEWNDYVPAGDRPVRRSREGEGGRPTSDGAPARHSPKGGGGR